MQKDWSTLRKLRRSKTRQVERKTEVGNRARIRKNNDKQNYRSNLFEKQ